MKRITVIYSGWIDKTLDNEIRAAMARLGAFCWGMGYDYRKNERDLRFELPPDEDVK